MGKTCDHIDYSVRGSLRKGYLFRHKLCINYGVCYWYPGQICSYLLRDGEGHN